jgi:hypothetical protein
MAARWSVIGGHGRCLFLFTSPNRQPSSLYGSSDPNAWNSSPNVPLQVQL